MDATPGSVFTSRRHCLGATAADAVASSNGVAVHEVRRGDAASSVAVAAAARAVAARDLGEAPDAAAPATTSRSASKSLSLGRGEARLG